jgi:hypothetical protein
MDKLYLSILNSNKLLICLHKIIPGEIDEYKNIFLSHFKDKTEILYEFTGFQGFINFAENAKLLLINPVSSLAKKQYENNNLNKIHSNYPNIKSIQYYENKNTFFNNGPDNNILETAKNIFNEINKLDYDYDSVIISSGAYSCILANLFHVNLKKNVFVIGRMFYEFFGIKIKGNTKEHYISIPEEMKPSNYMKIEDGCYW